MLLTIPSLLSEAQVEECRRELEAVEWIDGKATAGYLSSRTKDNQQLAEGHPVARRLGNLILDELDRNSPFIAAALPLRVLPPLFNRYSGGQSYGGHIDGAIRPVPGSPFRVRADLSATLFLSAAGDYDGGELVYAEGAEQRRIKLAAGDMVLYGAGTVHHVTPVTRGTRLAAFFWVQSMVRDQARRDILLQLDNSIQQLGRSGADADSCVRLAGVYHNLLRQWADT